MGIEECLIDYKIGLKALKKCLSNASYEAELLTYNSLYNKSGFVRKLCRNKLMYRYNIFVANDVKIGKGLHFPHPTGIVIGRGAIIGDSVVIYQQVTIGGKNIGDTKDGRIPEIQNGVTLFAGSKILGNVRIGECAMIGANAVVLTDVEERSTYVGIPARRVK